MRIWPLESISNMTQMFAALAIIIFVWAFSNRTKEPVIARFFALGTFTFFLGDLFWSLYILLFGEAPSGVSPADIGWIGGYCFLIGLMQTMSRGKRRPRWLFVIPLIVAIDAGVWISWANGNVGSIISDVVYGIVISVMGWHIFANLAVNNKVMRPFFISAACYFIAEIALFTSWGDMYAVFDFSVTAAIIAMAVTFMKAIRAEEVAR